MIQQAGEALNIDLRTRQHDNNRSFQCSSRKQHIRKRRPRDTSDDNDQSSSTEHAQTKAHTAYARISRFDAHDLFDKYLRLPDGELLPPLLFRAYSNQSRGSNGSEGFKAAGWDPLNAVSTADNYGPSISDERLLAALEKHMYREHFDSPLISTSPSLIWAVQKALSHSDSSIAVIDPIKVAEKKLVVHGHPFYTMLKESGRVKSHWYGAMFEWLIWREIDSFAVLTTLRSMLSTIWL